MSELAKVERAVASGALVDTREYWRRVKGIPPGGRWFSGPFGSLIFSDAFLDAFFAHWHRLVPGDPTPGPGGHWWGATCAKCNQGCESSNNATAVWNIKHKADCIVHELTQKQVRREIVRAVKNA